MKWRDVLTAEIDDAYRATESLIDRVDDSALDWKPESGPNWMTTGQLLRHIPDSCGMCFKGFVTGDWGMPEGMDPANMKPEEMLPPAEGMPSVSSKAEAKELLAKDKQLALDMLAQCSDDELDAKPAPAPWDPRPVALGLRFLSMVNHLNSHKDQLFYYLKLQGQPVNTMHKYGMA